MTEKTAEQLLTDAADIVARDGHFKGHFDDGDPVHGAVCAEGALRRAWSGSSSQGSDYDYSADPQLFKAWQRLLSALATTGFASPCVYNDSRQTTAEDVILLFKRAASADE